MIFLPCSILIPSFAMPQTERSRVSSQRSSPSGLPGSFPTSRSTNITPQPTQPSPSESEYYGVNHSILEALRGLHPKFYRIYTDTKSRGFVSIRPMADEPSLSSFFLEHVAPPTTVHNITRHIRNRENLGTNTCKLFVGIVGGQELIELSPTSFVSYHNTSDQQLGTRENPYQLLITGLDAPQWLPETRIQLGLRFPGFVNDVATQEAVQENVLTARHTVGAVVLARQMGNAHKPFHYRVYWAQGYTAMSSINPVNQTDLSLSQSYDEFVSPPRTGQDYTQYIASREGFHPSRVKLFKWEGDEQRQIIPAETLSLKMTGFGSAADPVLVLLDTNEGHGREPDRRLAAMPSGFCFSLKRWFGEGMGSAPEERPPPQHVPMAWFPFPVLFNIALVGLICYLLEIKFSLVSSYPGYAILGFIMILFWFCSERMLRGIQQSHWTTILLILSIGLGWILSIHSNVPRKDSAFQTVPFDQLANPPHLPEAYELPKGDSRIISPSSYPWWS